MTGDELMTGTLVVVVTVECDLLEWCAGQLVTVGAQEVMVTSSVM